MSNSRISIVSINRDNASLLLDGRASNRVTNCGDKRMSCRIS